MSSTSRYVGKLPDRDLIRAFESVATKFSEHSPQVTFNDSMGGVDAALLDTYKKKIGSSAISATLRIGYAHWSLHRLTVEDKDPNAAGNDKLTFSYNQSHGAGDRSLVVTVQSALESALSRPLASVDVGQQSLAAHSEVLAAIESAISQVLIDATSHRQELEKSYLDKESALTSRIDELRERELSRVEEEKQRISKSLDERQKSLDERAGQLDHLQKSLDDRNNTHVRRQIRESLLSLAKERLANFSVSRETRFQYAAVHFVSLIGLVLLVSGTIFYGAQVAGTSSGLSSTDITFGVKSALLAAAAVALGSWYLGWLNRWLQRIADAEFKLQQFRLDIERASWLAETVLEWKSSSQEPFPDLLASRLSAGLFQGGASDVDDPKTPATHLAEALFGAASSVKLRLGDQELNFDRRGVKELN